MPIPGPFSAKDLRTFPTAWTLPHERLEPFSSTWMRRAKEASVAGRVADEPKNIVWRQAHT